MTSKIELDYRIVKNTKILGDNSEVVTYKLQELIPRKFLWFKLKDKWRDIKLPCIGKFYPELFTASGTLAYIDEEFNNEDIAKSFLEDYKDRFIYYKEFVILRLYNTNYFSLNHKYEEKQFRYYNINTGSGGFYSSYSTYYDAFKAIDNIIQSKKDKEIQKKKSIILEIKQEII